MYKYSHVLFGCKYLPPANEVWGKVIFSVASVKNSVHREGGSASVHARIPLPADPPESRPRYQAPPLGAEHARRYGQRAGGTHPTGMHSCSTMEL